MENKTLIPRANVLTENDLEALRSLLAEHPCKYPFTPAQASTLVELADSVDSAKKITFKICMTAAVLLILGWMSKGFVQWIITALKTGGVSK